ncbi:hypothetical protein MAPG_03786 [Magnaporthiopsis poae ATCC 64411]|uniref:Uncharacterized protein n=1 Tax=Magnaporthiopsis poae (strain ATCC 64411 / 73-15) TaxID=644358 RepID=A0A0C4DUZ1_MAGP6|nr:hypothetical protein MAPG_03786 [Magnaporthiopsis poae ATCC 64411]
MTSQQRQDELLRDLQHFHEESLKTLRSLEALAAGNQTTVTDTSNKTSSRRRANSFFSCEAPEMDRRVGSSSSSGGGEVLVPGSPSLQATRVPFVPMPLSSPPSTAPRPITHTLSIDSQNLSVHSPLAVTGLGVMPPGVKHIPVSLYSNESDAEEDCDFIPLLPLIDHQPAKLHQQQQQPQQQQSIPIPPRSSPQDGEIASAQTLLPSRSFSGEQLVRHVQNLDEGRAGTLIALLDDTWRRRSELDEAKLLATREGELYGSATYEVYDVGRDSVATPQHDERGSTGDGALDLETVWNTVKDINPVTAGQDHQGPATPAGGAVGRMTILQEPSPIMLSAAHLTMAEHFDMDELIQHLVTQQGNKGKTRAYMQHRAFESSEVRQRSFFFVFKYYTAVGEGLSPAPYQQYDRRAQDYKSPDHIEITECSSVLALSLGGPPVSPIYMRGRRRRSYQSGKVFDHFAPWHLLSIQSFADNEHSMRSDDAKKPFYSGPYAFLDSLAAEYRDAAKRYALLNDMITKLITPSSQFMFEVKLRDKLLFEDKYFTYSRRYFWAYNSLALINEGIKAMIAAYSNTFTGEFWEGRHRTLWPLPGSGGGGGDEEEGLEGWSADARRNYLDKMAALREELKRTMHELWAVHHRNEVLRKEIKSLREQLFSGSSVKESRRAIEQGDNIKILTSVSMIFLPLTFVTSVFGITEFNISPDDWRFATTMVCVCVPFFVLIVVLQTQAGMEMCKRLGGSLKGYFQGEDEQTKHRRELQSLAGRVDEGVRMATTRAATATTAEGGGGGVVVEVEERGGRKQPLLFGRRKKAELGGGPSAVAAGNDVEAARGGSVRGGWFWRWRRVFFGGQPQIKTADENV